MDHSSDAGTLYLIVTGAPLTRHAAGGVAAARDRGWSPAVIATQAAEAWLPRADLDATETPVLIGHREPDQAKRLPAADAVVLAPATFNTTNKLAAGIADNYALSVLCEALSTRIPTVLVPFVSTRLAGHPAWPASLTALSTAGVTVLDPRTGTIGVDEPLESGAGWHNGPRRWGDFERKLSWRRPTTSTDTTDADAATPATRGPTAPPRSVPPARRGPSCTSTPRSRCWTARTPRRTWSPRPPARSGSGPRSGRSCPLAAPGASGHRRSRRGAPPRPRAQRGGLPAAVSGDHRGADAWRARPPGL